MGGETCSHSWRLPKRTLWARRPAQRLSRPKALSSSSSSYPYDCSLCALYCSLSSGVLQSSQEGEERVGGGRLIPVPEVSKASSDLMRYCGEHAKNDPLLMGIAASENPFKDKKPCTVL
ncbi:Guanine nucleotide-binding protein G(I)/G(S)/G(O) subunit gamma-12 [Liparis tanakae]|uniref:Guanine nucleotide-binding protein subunit gamma n=1 Tax=Liparis tanakae TaxID=230148 RepID=A0A4Z2G8C9_9TELE|nr:Guanine nucleotide-binding protein G(I)/G(S)/G(O) subunit gamma-12 [Liparis tanakae]